MNNNFEFDDGLVKDGMVIRSLAFRLDLASLKTISIPSTPHVKTNVKSLEAEAGGAVTSTSLITNLAKAYQQFYQSKATPIESIIKSEIVAPLKSRLSPLLEEPVEEPMDNTHESYRKRIQGYVTTLRSTCDQDQVLEWSLVVAMLEDIMQCILSEKKLSNEQAPDLFCIKLKKDVPVTVLGDIHGDLQSLDAILRDQGHPCDRNYVFMGDYVDRGRHNLQTLLLLLCYRVLYPNNFVLLRGNHEDIEMNTRYTPYQGKNIPGTNLGEEIKRHYGPEYSNMFGEAYINSCLGKIYRHIPLSASYGDYFLCHGGVCSQLQRFEDPISELNSIYRHYRCPEPGKNGKNFDTKFMPPKKVIADLSRIVRKNTKDTKEEGGLEDKNSKLLTDLTLAHSIDMNILWSDPAINDPAINEYDLQGKLSVFNKYRGGGEIVSEKLVTAVLEKLGKQVLLRGHTYCNGSRLDMGNRVLTLHSSPAMNDARFDGAVLTIDPKKNKHVIKRYCIGEPRER